MAGGISSAETAWLVADPVGRAQNSQKTFGSALRPDTDLLAAYHRIRQNSALAIQGQRALGDPEIRRPGLGTVLAGRPTGPACANDLCIVGPQRRAAKMQRCAGRLVDHGPKLKQQIGGRAVVLVAQIGPVRRKVHVQRQRLRRDLDLAAHGARAAQQFQVPSVREQAILDGEICYLHQGDGEQERRLDFRERKTRIQPRLMPYSSRGVVASITVAPT